MTATTAKLGHALACDGTVAAASTAPFDTTYACPACDRPVALERRRGEPAHFVHLADAPACDPDRAATAAAARILAEQIRAELREAGSFAWHQRCPGIAGRCRNGTILSRRRTVRSWDRILRAVRSGAETYDVAIMDGRSVAFGFVLRARTVPAATPAVTGRVPSLELAIDDVLAFRPRVPSGRSHAPELCGTCEAASAAARRQGRRPGGSERQERSPEQAPSPEDREAARVEATWTAILELARARG